MKAHVKTGNQKVNTYVDSQTGEILSTEIKTSNYVVTKGEEFCLLYTSCINILEKWNLSISDLQTFAYLCNHYANGQIFTMNQNIKIELGKMNKKSPTSYNNSTRNLLEKDLIVEAGHRAYRLNPKYIWKGDSNSRKLAILSIKER